MRVEGWGHPWILYIIEITTTTTIIMVRNPINMYNISIHIHIYCLPSGAAEVEPSLYI